MLGDVDYFKEQIMSSLIRQILLYFCKKLSVLILKNQYYQIMSFS